jgi:hypothetical protein
LIASRRAKRSSRSRSAAPTSPSQRVRECAQRPRHEDTVDGMLDTWQLVDLDERNLVLGNFHSATI